MVETELNNIRVKYLETINSKNSEEQKALQFKTKLDTTITELNALSLENNDLRQKLR